MAALGSKDSLIMEEVTKIVSSDAETVAYTWELEFKIKDTFTGELKMSDEDYKYVPEEEKTEKIFKPLKITNIDFINDFEKTAIEEIHAAVIIPFGMWAKCLCVAKDDLLAILRRTPLKTGTYEVNEDEEIEEFKYDCIFHLDQDQNMEGSDIAYRDRFTLDNTGAPLLIRAELLNRGVEQARKITVGGIYRNVVPEDFVKNILSYHLTDVEVDGEKAFDVISVVEVNNKNKRDHIIIPHAFPLLDVPNYIQKNAGGVYNAGLNCYVQKNKVYVFPIYQTDRFNKEEKNLTVYKLSTTVAEQLEKTFFVDGEALSIVGLSDTSYSDRSLTKKLGDGNGVRFTDSRKFMNGFVETKDNKAIAHRKESNTEFLAEDLKDQDNVQLSPNGINSNPFRERSLLASRNGALYTFKWDNSNPDLLYPGMPARILYEENDQILEMRGILLGVHTSIALIGEGMTAGKHGTITGISIFALPFVEGEA